MKHIKKRVSKIVDELLTYLFKIGSNNINIGIIEEKKHYKITFTALIHHVDEKDIDLLVKCLNCDKSEEMEEYYWELTGECDTDTELSIVGMMIDEFEVDLTEDKLELIIYRNKGKRGR